MAKRHGQGLYDDGRIVGQNSTCGLTEMVNAAGRNHRPAGSSWAWLGREMAGKSRFDWFN